MLGIPTNGSGFSQTMTAAVLAIGIGLTPFGTIAHACAFDVTKPERTAIDWILDSDTLVFARPDPENEFAYQVVEVLRGEQSTYDVPLLVHTQHRRNLMRNPEHTVLFRKTNDQNWVQVAYVDESFSQILQTALAHADQWKDGYHPSRFAAFEALQTSANPKLRDLAIGELDKAPYDMLRKLDVQIATEDLLADLWTPAGYPYQPIRVLLLGLSGGDKARDEIYDYFERTHDWDWANNIGAFAAALVELDGVAGISYLDGELLTNRNQSLDKVRGVISALAVQRSAAAPDVIQAIDQVLAQMVETRPETAPLVAQQFAVFSDWSQADPLAKLAGERRLITAADLMTVSVYLAQARGAMKSKDTAAEKG